MFAELSHEPAKGLPEEGAHIVTLATQDKLGLFDGTDRLDLLLSCLFESAVASDWRLQAWALFPNHMHFVSSTSDRSCDAMDERVRAFRALSARVLNRYDGATGRAVWFRAWLTRLTFESSYLARIAYVHNNPVRHGLVKRARDYRWCSAQWFEDTAPQPFARKVMALRTDRVHVIDDFDG